MNEENNLMAASELSRISEKHYPFYAFLSQKSESLPHSFFLHKIGCGSAISNKFDCAHLAQFFDGSRSKVIFRVTQKSPAGSFAFPRKPCSARLPIPPPAPDGCIRRSRLKPKPVAPDGRNFWAFGWCVPVCIWYAFSTLSDGQCSLGLVELIISPAFHNLKSQCYGKK